jgi:hypothetical protein
MQPSGVIKNVSIISAPHEALLDKTGPSMYPEVAVADHLERSWPRRTWLRRRFVSLALEKPDRLFRGLARFFYPDRTGPVPENAAARQGHPQYEREQRDFGLTMKDLEGGEPSARCVCRPMAKIGRGLSASAGDMANR